MNSSLFWTNNVFQTSVVLHVKLCFPQCLSVDIPPQKWCVSLEELRLEPSRLPQTRFFICYLRKRTKSIHPTNELCYVTGKIKGLYILSLKGHMQSTSLPVSNLDASVLLSQHVGFAPLEEAKGQLTKTLRKILSALIFSAPSFIGPSEERADMPKWVGIEI